MYAIDAEDDADESPVHGAVMPPIVTALRTQLDRIRGDLDTALHGSIGQLEEFQRATAGALARVAELEQERMAYQMRLAHLEHQVSERMQNFEQAEAALKMELAQRDARIRELSSEQARWAEKAEALAEIRKRVDSLLSG